MLLIKIEKTGDVMKLLTDTINQVGQGSLDCRIGNTIGYLAGIALKAYETSELEGRLEKLETAVKSQ